MKNVYIGGTARSGKTTLARKLYHECNYSLFEMDTIAYSFSKVFPELGIDMNDAASSEKVFAPFADRIIKCCGKDLKYGDVKIAINGCQIFPSTLNSFKNKDNLIVIFLGMSDIDENYLFETIKKTQDADDWTSHKSDKSLLEICKNLIEESKKIKKECEEFGFLYFDTCKNREDVFEKIAKFLKETN